VQTEQARNAWKQSQQEIYCSLVTDGVDAGMTLAEARLSALEKSITDADGFEDCSPNAVSQLLPLTACFLHTIVT
jgi:hypothetical protein